MEKTNNNTIEFRNAVTKQALIFFLFFKISDLGKVIFRKWVRYARNGFLILVIVNIANCLKSQVYFNEIAYAFGIGQFECAYELYNPSNNPINLSTYVISNGVDTFHIGDITITPGEHLRVVRFDKPEFCQYYELALYSQLNTPPSALIDYIQFDRRASSNLASIAVANNVWKDVNDFVEYNNDPIIARVANTNKAARGGFDTTLNHFRVSGDIHTLTFPNPCPDDFVDGPKLRDLRIRSIETKYADYETDGVIESEQIIDQPAIVDYDAGLEILLVEGFEVKLGAEFLAFIDGCDLGGGGLHN